MKLLIITSILFSGIVISCASSGKAMKKNAYSSFKNISETDSLFASIERTPCYGRCPTYKLNIYNTGYASYEGIRNVKMVGNFSGRFSPSQMDSLKTVATSIGYMELKDEYDSENISDLPSTITSIVIDGVRKKVKRRYNYPASILTFETVFDSLSNHVNWTPLTSTK